LIPAALVAALPEDTRPEAEALLAALSPPDGTCVGIEVSVSSGEAERTAWWRTLDADGRPLASGGLFENERGRFVDASTWTRSATRERREDVEDGELVRVETTTLRGGRPARVVLDRDEAWGESRLVTTFRYDAGGREVLRVDRYQEGPLRKRTTTATTFAGDGSAVRVVTAKERSETYEVGTERLAFDAQGRLVERVLDDGGQLAWTWDDAGRVTALHRVSPLIGEVDVTWIRDADGALLGSVEVGETHRVDRAYTAGCGDEPDPAGGDVR
jgi:YD repeat-containing protein